MNMLTAAVILALLSFSNSLLLKEYQNSVELDDTSDKAFKLYWSHKTAEPQWMYFAIEAKTTGWVAVGFAEKIDGMKNYDVVIGYVLPSKPSTEMKDCLTNGHRTPPVDNLQNYYMTDSSEINGTTTLQFKRKLDTGDSKGDLVIKPGDMLVVWAYGKFDNLNLKHYSRGYKTLKLISGVPSITHAASWMLLLVPLFAQFL